MVWPLANGAGKKRIESLGNYLQLARHLGISLERCQAEHTNLDMLVWAEDMLAEWNRPNRTDHYLMQIAMELRLVYMALIKRAGRLSLKDFKIPFKLPGEAEPQQSSEQRVEQSKQRWLGFVGHSKVIRPPKVPKKRQR